MFVKSYSNTVFQIFPIFISAITTLFQTSPILICILVPVLNEGEVDGDSLGDTEGDIDGLTEGDSDELGLIEGLSLGETDRLAEGDIDRLTEGDSDELGLYELLGYPCFLIYTTNFLACQPSSSIPKTLGVS